MREMWGSRKRREFSRTISIFDQIFFFFFFVSLVALHYRSTIPLLLLFASRLIVLPRLSIGILSQIFSAISWARRGKVLSMVLDLGWRLFRSSI